MKKLLSIILTLTFCLASFSALAPTVAAADAFTEADAKAFVNAAVSSREKLSNNYYKNYMNYTQTLTEGNMMELLIPVEGKEYGDGERYLTLIEHLLPGGSYDGFLNDTRGIFTESVAERYCSKYYYDNNFELFIISSYYGDRLINAHDTMVHLGFYYVPENGKVELTEVTENRAKALVYCQKSTEPENIDIVVECIFEKTSDGWRIAKSDFADMLCSYRDYSYTVCEAPDTSDNAFDIITLCLGGIAVVMSAICLVRRRRVED